ncbi:MAG: hypothetical protein ACXADY_17350 [Candidatus Hodarchaeales archaeon]|jgi:hypothetical protein
MDNSAKTHNDRLMKTGYQILQQCQDEAIPCFLWAGGAIYHMLGGKLDYREMSDLEFFLPRNSDKQKKVDKQFEQILEQMGFIPYSYFNNIQNQYSTPRREFYLPNRELSDLEVEEVKHGRNKYVENVEFQKVEVFVDGIKMCWTFKFKELPTSYTDTVICPPGFQLALKANAIHTDDFDLKDIQDISSIVSSSCCGEVTEKDTIFKEPHLDENIEFKIGKEIFEYLSNLKYDFPTTIIRNYYEILNYSGLTESGKKTLLELIEFLKPLEKKNKSGGFLAKARKEKPQRVDARTL